MQNAPVPRRLQPVSLGGGGTIGPLLAEALAADSQTRSLLTGARLPGVVDALIAKAEGAGYGALLGASVAGHNLVGAMSYKSEKLHPWAPSHDTQVLVVDAVVAGLGGLSVAASHAHALGATHTDFLVVSISEDALAAQFDSKLHRILMLGSGLRLAA
jgi:hypothetical protein